MIRGRRAPLRVRVPRGVVVAAGPAAVVALAGCGGHSGGHARPQPAGAHPGSTTTRAAATTPPGSIPVDRATRPPARGTLLVFKRVVSPDPVSSQLTIDRDGWATARLTLGGESGPIAFDFRVGRARRRALIALLARSHPRNTAWSDVRHYVYWLSSGGRTWRFEQIRLTPSMRPLVAELNHMLDRHTDSLTGRRS